MIESVIMPHAKTPERQGDHSFGQSEQKSGEKRTIFVVALTGVTMIVEIAAGIVFGSMALLADGLHMCSHFAALSISALAYRYTRRHAHDPNFNFGTGKINSLAAYSSAILLLIFALFMVVESVKRFIDPVVISFNYAIAVAVIGFVVNGISLLILHGGHSSRDGRVEKHSDHNLWAAYIHVLADTFTSLLAISALIAGKYFGQIWLDPMMGILGAILITRWSIGLIRASGKVLLDMRAPEEQWEAIREAVSDENGVSIADLHIWAIGAEIYAAEIILRTDSPKPASYYKDQISKKTGILHINVEIQNGGG